MSLTVSAPWEYNDISMKKQRPRFQKTSVQLAPTVFRDLESWPGLTQSEAIRLFVERGHYLSTLDSDRIASVSLEYQPILVRALEDLEYADYRIVVRSLPEIVAGYVAENCNRNWRSEVLDQHQLDPQKLIAILREMNAQERIGILDCTVADRHASRGESD